MKILSIALAFLTVSLVAKSQPINTNDIENGKYAPYLGKPFVLFVNSKDTIFCDKVELWMKGQELQEVDYTVAERKIILKEKDVLQLQAFYAENKILMELMPLDPEKPDKKKQHLFKNLVGYFTVWTNNHMSLMNLQQFNWGGNVRVFPTTLEFMSIGNGPIFRVTKSKLEELIYPMFEKCKGIQKTQMQGFFELNYMELTDKCLDYNRLCAPDHE